MKAQELLDFYAEQDDYGFLVDINTNWESHRPFLLMGLHLTDNKKPVVELGSGDGSTKFLKEYCKDHTRKFYSYESNKEWSDKTGSTYIPDWDKANIWQSCGLLFVDHAPGEHRKVAIKRMQALADIIVVHDTELNGAGAYGFEPLWPLFRYVIHLNRTGGGAGATMVSNVVDLNKFKGLFIGKYRIE